MAWKGSERCKTPRQPSNLPVRVVLPMTSGMVHGQLLDLSEGGCCVEPDEPFLVWNSIRVEIRFEASRMQFRLAGVTRGSRGGKSFGVEFDNMTAERLAQLTVLLPLDPAVMNGIDVQVAMHEPEQVRSHPAQKPLGGKERRIHARYRVTEKVVMLLVQSGESLHGDLLEVSQSGCRIRLEKAYTGDLGAYVELCFRLRGIPVRVAAEIQVQIGANVVGVRFTGVSGRKQQQLLELLAEVKEAVAKGESTA